METRSLAADSSVDTSHKSRNRTIALRRGPCGSKEMPGQRLGGRLRFIQNEVHDPIKMVDSYTQAVGKNPDARSEDEWLWGRRVESSRRPC